MLETETKESMTHRSCQKTSIFIQEKGPRRRRLDKYNVKANLTNQTFYMTKCMRSRRVRGFSHTHITDISWARTIGRHDQNKVMWLEMISDWVRGFWIKSLEVLYRTEIKEADAFIGQYYGWLMMSRDLGLVLIHIRRLFSPVFRMLCRVHDKIRNPTN